MSSQTDEDELFRACCSDIEAAHLSLGHALGWRFVTCPRDNFTKHARFWLITLHPGGRRDYPEHPQPSQEAGSAYLVESWDDQAAGTDPLQRQIQMLFDELAKQTGSPSGNELLSTSLSSHFIPFRAPSFAELKNKRSTIEFSKRLWRRIVSTFHPNLLIVLDRNGYKAFSQILASQFGQALSELEYPTGWGSYVARIRQFPNGPTLCWIPNLSRFKIFGRPESAAQVVEIVKAATKNASDA
jgi:hypothetical protein